MHIIKGKAASRGTAKGIAYYLKKQDTDLKSVCLSTDEEIALFDSVRSKTIENIIKSTEDKCLEGFNDVKALILQDDVLIANTKKLITNHMDMYSAFEKSLLQTIAKLENSKDAQFAVRAEDLRDLKMDLMDAARGCDPRISHDISNDENRQIDEFIKKYPNENIVVLGETLSVRQFMKFPPKKITAIVLQKGSDLSHMAIVARSKQIPMLIGADIDWNIFTQKFCEDDRRLFAEVDADKGICRLHDDNDAYAKKVSNAKTAYAKCDAGLVDLTCDNALPKENFGRDIEDYYDEYSNFDVAAKIPVLVNLNDFSNDGIKDIGSSLGVGLVRTEMLYFDYDKSPQKEEISAILSKVGTVMKQKKVVVRIPDFSPDKLPSYLGSSMSKLDFRPDNLPPYLGSSMSKLDFSTDKLRAHLNGSIRGIDFVRNMPDEFEKFIRAFTDSYLLNGNLELLIPMIISCDDYAYIKSCIEKLFWQELSQTNHVAKGVVLPRIGAMIETIGACEDIDDIVESADFVCIGTNDLSEQITGKSREEDAEFDYSSLIPYLAKVSVAAHRAGKPVGICGAIEPQIDILSTLMELEFDYISAEPAVLWKIAGMLRELE